ncbi:hypothetical protein IQ254_04340 [Nodosilinea sp. LEGE 07088]|uniref:hypothetical protein n=1 Tax=Nodosilinea sp. LEGE 07088 TaxID=2777968 RepID=UPI001881F3FB|nr:hypothetical protein [Nodosilinea sp. LEGE 07088]MBE9136434.1 hypothetical protein [Nodosilinea sp. LEGE 07088]
MSVKVITRPLKTVNITVVSNATSLHVQGDKVTKLSAIPGQEAVNPASISVDLTVQDPQTLPGVLAAAEALELMFNVEDALELGLLLVAMGLENTSRDRISATLDRLTQLIGELG